MMYKLVCIEDGVTRECSKVVPGPLADIESKRDDLNEALVSLGIPFKKQRYAVRAIV